MANIPKMKVEPSKRIPPGRHAGRILSHSYEERPNGEKLIAYIDLAIGIKVEGSEEPVVLKASFPATKLTPDGRLMRLLGRFGYVLKLGETVDVAGIMADLDGMNVTVRAFEEKSDNGTFTRIDPDTVTPANPL